MERFRAQQPLIEGLTPRELGTAAKLAQDEGGMHPVDALMLTTYAHLLQSESDTVAETWFLETSKMTPAALALEAIYRLKRNKRH